MSLESHLRLFLSVDVHGSLALKNSKNHVKLLNLYQERRSQFSSLVNHELIDSSQAPNSPSDLIKLLLRDYSTENSDWAAILERQFQHFHDAFSDELQKTKQKVPDISPDADRIFWKAIGDELIYQVRLTNPEYAHHLVVAFLNVIRLFDSKATADDPQFVRLKGAGWVAGFPIRNREVTLPASTRDYLGPDIDAGFRLAKMGHPGLMVISLELAYLLGKGAVEFRPVRGAIVGWEKLKSVWDDIPYPIIWITLPVRQGKDYEEFLPWAHADNRFVKQWKAIRDGKGLAEISELQRELEQIRLNLPKSLGVVAPYIVSASQDQSGEMPEEHGLILKILEALSPGDEGRQQSPVEDQRRDGFEAYEEAVDRLLEERIQPSDANIDAVTQPEE